MVHYIIDTKVGVNRNGPFTICNDSATGNMRIWKIFCTNHYENISENKDEHIIFVTSNGKIRKNNLEDFSSINTSGKIAMKLEQNDKIAGVQI